MFRKRKIPTPIDTAAPEKSPKTKPKYIWNLWFNNNTATHSNKDGSTEVHDVKAESDRLSGRLERRESSEQNHADGHFDAGIVDDIKPKRRWWRFWKRGGNEDAEGDSLSGSNDNPLRRERLKNWLAT